MRRQEGFSMIEVLVTMVILMLGLLGLAGLMIASQRAEVEAYQRAHKSGQHAELRVLRPYLGIVGKEWWERLTSTRPI